MAKRSYSIYMFADTCNSFEDCLTENARKKPVEFQDTKEMGDFKVRALLFKSQNQNPKMIKEVRALFSEIPVIRTTSIAIVLLFEFLIDDRARYFAATFGYGHSFLNDILLVQDFGLKVAINRLDPEEIKNIYKSTLTDSSRSAKEASASSSVANFSFDLGQDLLTRIQGKFKIGDLSATVNGATSVRTSKEQDITNLPNEILESYRDYKIDKYKNGPFKFIDIYKPVFDPILISNLESKALSSINNNKNEIEIIHPFELDPKLSCYYYFTFGRKSSQEYREISVNKLKKFLEQIGMELEQTNINKLKLRIRNSDNDFDQSIDIAKCFVGSILFNDVNYAVENRKWYQLDKAFQEGINSMFRGQIKFFESLFPLQEEIPDKNGKMAYPSEDKINEILAGRNGFILTDRINLNPISGEQFQKFELADLVDIDSKRFIHVKKGRNSTKEIAYLFTQGKLSVDEMSTKPQVYIDLVSRLRKPSSEVDQKLVDRLEFELQKIVLSDWAVEFWIIDEPNEMKGHSIPFAARAHFNDVFNHINSRVREVNIRFIDPNKNYDSNLNAAAPATLAEAR